MGEVGTKYVIGFLLGGAGVWLRMFLTQSLNHSIFPFGTLFVNILGSTLIGFLVGCGERGLIPWSPALQVAVIGGGLGALTTFSTFSMETLKFLQMGAYQRAAINLVLNNLAALVFCYFGWRCGQGK